MATRLYYRDAPASYALGKGISQGNDEWPPDTGSSRGYLVKALSTARGGAATTAVINTIASGVTGIAVLLTKTAGATPGIIFISEPVDQDVTISGSVLHNLRAAESNMSANAAINVAIYKLGKDTFMAIGASNSTLIDATARTTELAVTTETAVNFSETPAGGITLQKGDRLLIHVGFGQAGTMASGFTCTFWYDGPTAAASGDSYIEFTETFGFLTTAPTGTQLFLTDAAADIDVHGSRHELELGFARGAGVTSITTTNRMPADYNGTGTSYARDVASGLTDSLASGIKPLVVRAGDAILASQTAETATNHTPILDTSAAGSGDIVAQSFVAEATEWAYAMAAMLNKSGSTSADYTFALYTDNGSDRPGSLILDNTGITFALLDTSAYNYVFLGEQPSGGVEVIAEEGAQLTNASKYWLRIHCTTAGTAGAGIQTRGADGSNDNYANGSRIYSTDSGSTWTQPTNEDWAFKVLGGRIIEWYTPQLEAFTLSGLVRVNLRAAGSDAATGMGMFAALWRVDSDGSNPTLYGVGQMNNANGGLLTASEAAYQFDLVGDDLAVASGQRLRLRVYAMGTPDSTGMVEGDSFTFYYAGTSGGASGDSYVTFPVTLTEHVASETVQRRVEPVQLVPVHYPNRW